MLQNASIVGALCWELAVPPSIALHYALRGPYALGQLTIPPRPRGPAPGAPRVRELEPHPKPSDPSHGALYELLRTLSPLQEHARRQR